MIPPRGSIRGEVSCCEGGTVQRVLNSGKIVFTGGSFSVDCTIRNLSETGARLHISDKFTLLDRMLARVARQLSFGAREIRSACGCLTRASEMPHPFN
jgi:hypothetical protein